MERKSHTGMISLMGECRLSFSTQEARLNRNWSTRVLKAPSGRKSGAALCIRNDQLPTDRRNVVERVKSEYPDASTTQ